MLETRLLAPTGSLRPLDLDRARLVERLLCDDSRGGSAWRGLLVRPDFEPDGFTVAERMNGEVLLEASESDFGTWLSGVIEGKVRRVLPSGGHAGTAAVAAFCHAQTMRLLEHSVAGAPVARTLANQELPSVVDRVVAHCAFGDVRAPVATHRGYADRSVRAALDLAPLVLNACGSDLAALLRYSLAAGLLGAEQKLRTPGPGLALPVGAPGDPAPTARDLWPRYRKLAERALHVDHWDAFLADVLDGPRQLVWFFDDCAETVIDLLLLDRLMEANPRLRLTLVPKSLPCYTDADAPLLLRLLDSPRLRALGVDRLRATDVCTTGPSMATANLRKLSPELARALYEADCVFVKGTNVHEMFQGGISKVMYTGFVLVSEFNEGAMGVNAATAPLFLVRSEPGEYTNWGFEGRRFRTRRYADGRHVRLCWSTLTDRERRKECTEPVALRDEWRRLDALAERVAPRTRVALESERGRVRRRLQQLTGTPVDPTPSWSPHA
ncbi:MULTISPECIES: ARMT1-like domain-containing protein [Streptomyces]|uniref:ARMT1-like domain-containing protein n=1 Tax=Streptomyces TaxID=1883 RepID=UPI000F657161|nr:ARMT1-like domain-containing protein [Streptomyces alboflavus]